MKIIMTVHHGQIFKEIANGVSFDECLDKLEKTPLYIGYGGNRNFILPLKEKKTLRGGWCDFVFEP